jgi:hypothetical protein
VLMGGTVEGAAHVRKPVLKAVWCGWGRPARTS